MQEEGQEPLLYENDLTSKQLMLLHNDNEATAVPKNIIAQFQMIQRNIFLIKGTSHSLLCTLSHVHTFLASF